MRETVLFHFFAFSSLLPMKTAPLPPSPWDKEVDCKLEKWKLQQQLQKNSRCCCVITALSVMLWFFFALTIAVTVHFVWTFRSASHQLELQRKENEFFFDLCKNMNWSDTSVGREQMDRNVRLCQQVADKASVDVLYEAAVVAFDDLLGHFVPPGIPCNDICRRFLENVVAWAGVIVLSTLLLVALTIFYCVRPFWEYKHRLLVQLQAHGMHEAAIHARQRKEAEALAQKQSMMEWLEKLNTQSSTLMDPHPPSTVTAAAAADEDDSSSDVAEHA